MNLRTLALALLAALPGVTVGDAPAAAHSPYAAGVGADIKALSADEVKRSRLRAVHLSAHLEQVRILDAAQVARYAELRGYSGRTDHSQGHH